MVDLVFALSLVWVSSVLLFLFFRVCVVPSLVLFFFFDKKSGSRLSTSLVFAFTSTGKEKEKGKHFWRAVDLNFPEPREDVV